MQLRIQRTKTKTVMPHPNLHIDRQIERQIDPIDRQTDRQIDRQIGRQIERGYKYVVEDPEDQNRYAPSEPIVRQIGRYIDRQIDIQIDRQIDRQIVGYIIQIPRPPPLSTTSLPQQTAQALDRWIYRYLNSCIYYRKRKFQTLPIFWI